MAHYNKTKKERLFFSGNVSLELLATSAAHLGQNNCFFFFGCRVLMRTIATSPSPAVAFRVTAVSVCSCCHLEILHTQ